MHKLGNIIATNEVEGRDDMTFQPDQKNMAYEYHIMILTLTLERTFGLFRPISKIKSMLLLIELT